jgi:putative pyruvate formate lyase activating enzyme
MGDERNDAVLTEAGFRAAAPDAEDLTARRALAERMLQSCSFCELRCGADRAAGERGPCGLAARAHVYKLYVSLNEEPEYAPALRVFFGGCNFRCPWCDEAPEAFHDAGQPVEPAALATEFGAALAAGVRAISILGGEPTLHVHTLLSLAAAAPVRLPLVVNTNLFLTPEALELLGGVVTGWLADLKFGNDECASRLAGVPRYWAVATRNLARIAARTRVIVRHVLLPGHAECCFRPVADWVAMHLPGTRFQLYPGYVPCGPAARDSVIGRLNSRAETAAAYAYLASLPLQTVAPQKAVVPRPGATSAQRNGALSLTLGEDGRVYCHDLTPDLAALLGDFCAPELDARAAQRAPGERQCPR